MADIALTAAKIAPVDPDEAEIYDVIATETITAGQALYQVTTTGKFGVADANAAGKQQIRGIALNGGGAGQAISMLKRGRIAGFTLTNQNYDDIVYLSDTAGSLADGAGTMTVRCGRVVALSDASLTKVIYFDADWRSNWS
jgi:hypothetical protein